MEVFEMCTDKDTVEIFFYTLRSFISSPAGTSQNWHALSSFLGNLALKDSFLKWSRTASVFCFKYGVKWVSQDGHQNEICSFIHSETVISAFLLGLVTKKLYTYACTHAPLSYMCVCVHIYVYIYIYVSICKFLTIVWCSGTVNR